MRLKDAKAEAYQIRAVVGHSNEGTVGHLPAKVEDGVKHWAASGDSNKAMFSEGDRRLCRFPIWVGREDAEFLEEFA